MTITILYNRRKTDGAAAVDLYVYFNHRDHIYISTKVKVDKKDWDVKNLCVRKTHKDYIKLNLLIKDKIRRIEQLEYECLRMRKPFNSDIVRDLINNRMNLTLNLYMRTELEADKPQLSAGRIGLCNSVLKNFDEFGTFNIFDFDYQALIKYHAHLRLTMKESTTPKNHKFVHKYLERARRSGLIHTNPYELFKMPKYAEKRTYLTHTEIQLLRDYKGVPRLETVRDMFLFQCNTGLAYADIVQLENKDIRLENDRMFIVKNRVKTDQTQMIPMLPEALTIIEKYKEPEAKPTDKCFKILTNQKMNAYLTELAQVKGIDKPLTTHVARHSYATLMLTAGMPLETISHILGHADTKTTAIYAKMLFGKITNDIDRLKIIGV